MIIRNKIESDEAIRKLNLNRINQRVFLRGQEKELIEYLENSKFSYYNIRDRSQSMGDFKYKVTKEEVLDLYPNYDKCSIYESFYEADSGLVLQGEIQINKQFEVIATLDDKKFISNRKAMEYPRYRLDFDLKERREPSIKGLTQIIDYIVEHLLFDMVVEFAIFSEPVGTHKEKLIIWELRNRY